jgi:hypothetical protein
MAARIPMMATTISSSIRVNPFCDFLNFFNMFCSPFRFKNTAQGTAANIKLFASANFWQNLHTSDHNKRHFLCQSYCDCTFNNLQNYTYSTNTLTDNLRHFLLTFFAESQQQKNTLVFFRKWILVLPQPEMESCPC